MGNRYSRTNLSTNHRKGSHRPHDIKDPNNVGTATTSSLSRSTNSIIIEGREYHRMDTSSYCLPRDELEQDRLNSQHFSLKALLGGNLLPSIESRIPRNANVLDLGCGSGCWVMEMAIEHPEFEVTGIDMADMFPATIRPENVKFEICDIMAGLPYPDNSFDFIHMRLMIVALRGTEWPLVLKEAYRVLKPGGMIGLVESDFTEKTDKPIVDKFNGEFFKAMKSLGQDPQIGSKLSTLLAEADFEIKDFQERFLCYGLPLDPIAREMLTNWKSAMLSLKPLLAHRVSADIELYPEIVEKYIEGIVEASWIVKIWAYSAQKPIAVEQN
ncbi:S-adenosyl-L-methionine-dependent methyltransferase [Helicostylum pulchrum]|uniref:Methyltransferase domain-containing protein n=1 Tax=Helicostylum pulchrum TaxID=562976 RepID=A0ABP9XWR8_9FUNG|nr:S-adenosyl-L-methionine-dependent methyltransferase [Helicostylum pulchrum]